MAARKRPARSFTLTMIGHAAAWHFEQAEQLAARPADATAVCPCCDTVYPSAGLKRLDSYAVYEQASKEVSFNWDDPICRFCREDFTASYATDDDDVYHVLDRGHDKND